jgi:glycosyltransferase involved in cell wall biosynthesis
VSPGGHGHSARRILLAAYFYPPCSDTGAHRPASLVKYLRRLGHHVTVLTTSAYGSGRGDAEIDVVRTADAQLWRARIHGESSIGSLYDNDTYSSQPHPLSKVLVPEPLVAAWLPFALRRARALHRAKPFECVITTSPPESVHMIGRSLSHRGAGWVADIRDAWNFEPLRPPFPTALQTRLDARLERRWLGDADVVTCVSEPAAQDLRERGIADPELVPNGADPELLAAADPQSVSELLDPARISLVYTGRFGSFGRDPAQLVEGITRLARESPELAAKLELVVAGPLTEAESALFAGDFSPASVVHVGSLERAQALALQRAADALLLIAQPRRSQLANFKLFEYLEAGPPVLALAEGTEAGRIVTEAGGETVRADDAEAIAAALARLVSGDLIAPGREARAAYAYPAVAERMAEAVERAIWNSQARQAGGYRASDDWRDEP